ncbi:MAG: arsenate reductase family protein [Planktomarina sp.]
MTLYGLKTCDTCRKALKALAENGNVVEYVDVRKDGVPDDVMTAAFAKFGMALVNKSSTTWRGLSDEAKARDALALLKSNPTLMKRPLIVRDETMTLGWKADVQKAYI